MGQPRRRRARPSLVFSDGSITTRLRRYPKRLGAGVGEKRGAREARDEAGCDRGAAGRRGEDRRAPSPVATRPARGRGPGSGFGVSVFFCHAPATADEVLLASFPSSLAPCARTATGAARPRLRCEAGLVALPVRREATFVRLARDSILAEVRSI